MLPEKSAVIPREASKEALGGHSEIRYVLDFQESIVVATGDGYARASGKFGVLHVNCRSGNNAFTFDSAAFALRSVRTVRSGVFPGLQAARSSPRGR